eukprot:scaffold1471_cov413-Prasinococcus_capsulatus_cf.AAC.18
MVLRETTSVGPSRARVRPSYTPAPGHVDRIRCCCRCPAALHLPRPPPPIHFLGHASPHGPVVRGEPTLGPWGGGRGEEVDPGQRAPRPRPTRASVGVWTVPRCEGGWMRDQ